MTGETIRKDLNDLCSQRVLTRTHGGAILSSGVENVAYDARRILAQVEKQGIGRLAATLIPNNSSLFVNIGTTTEEVARHLVHHEGLLVITNEHGLELGETTGEVRTLAAGEAATLSLRPDLKKLPPGTYYLSVIPSNPETGHSIGVGQYHVEIKL